MKCNKISTVGHTARRCPKPVDESGNNDDFGGEAEPESGAGADGGWGAGNTEETGDGAATAGGGWTPSGNW